MKAIHKYHLDASDSLTTLRLREGFRIVRFEYLVAEKGLFLWAEEPLRADVPYVDASFKVTMTGKPVAMHYEYMDTALDPFGPEAYHLFRVEESAAPQSPHTPPHLRNVAA
ncbi:MULTISPECIES: hypothetical protein [Marinobacterium]|uniref:DUF7352 domain-containing protein n=1 Tax=Marinobacterium iners DSM 11526 TaxID=1122198 RepID=A0A1H4EF04_9GAMM|nr:hypothetical protein [Marinobacterium iners]QSR35786.1 hypothetical protein CFI10_12390 [Marinobacterium iners]SEA83654.1 hypothetical protein SAMN02745729_10859 [Marinobacterium iners DSM 11526]